MSDLTIGIIGLGNVGQSLGLGLSQTAYADRVLACDRNQPKRDRLEERTGIETTPSWKRVLQQTETILLCIRTEQVQGFLEEATSFLEPSDLLVCLSAGVQLDELQHHVADAGCEVMRAITSVNVAAGEGYTLILGNETFGADDGLEEHVVQLFELLGNVRLMESEEALDEQSVITGCGPALTALFLEVLAASGEEVGFEEEDAQRMAEHCVQATLKTMQETRASPSEYKYRVAASGGVVERVLEGPESADVEKATASWFRSILTSL
jgi:pyrroline-5-carboxylate reductase